MTKIYNFNNLGNVPFGLLTLLIRTILVMSIIVAMATTTMRIIVMGFVLDLSIYMASKKVCLCRNQCFWQRGAFPCELLN